MKKEKWIKFRHRVVWKLAYPIVWLLTWCKYKASFDKFPEGRKGQYLVLMNHQTPFDQFWVAMSWGVPVYFVATEDIFSIGFLSKMLRFAVNPIPIRKFKQDINAIKTCMQVVKEGGTIVIAPEGNTTYSGRTEHMKTSVITLAKKLKLPIVLYKIEGGYGMHPRWSDNIRKGKMHAGVSEIISYEEYSKLSDEEFMKRISDGLFVNECFSGGRYLGKRRAEYLERVFYVCPDCGLSEFESDKNECSCKKCGKTIVYNEDKTIEGKGVVFPFKYICDWYDYQNKYINGLDPMKYCEKPIYSDSANIYEVVVFKKKNLLSKDATITLFGDRVEIEFGDCHEILSFSELEGVAVLGRNKLNISTGKKVYQIKGSKRFNALKYLNLFFRYKNVTKGDDYVEFLGL